MLKWPKTHANDAVAACLEEGEIVLPMEYILIKNHIEGGDYKQRKGKRSEIIIPTGKLFGFRKGDKIKIPEGIGFVKGKRSSGYFDIANLDGIKLHASAKIKNAQRISARTTTQVECLTLKQLTARKLEMEQQTNPVKKTKTTPQ